MCVHLHIKHVCVFVCVCVLAYIMCVCLCLFVCINIQLGTVIQKSVIILRVGDDEEMLNVLRCRLTY